jgi:hypothetical protein
MNPYSDYATDEQRDGVCKATNQHIAIDQIEFAKVMDRVRDKVADDAAQKIEAKQELLENLKKTLLDLSFNQEASPHLYEAVEAEIDILEKDLS